MNCVSLTCLRKHTHTHTHLQCLIVTGATNGIAGPVHVMHNMPKLRLSAFLKGKVICFRAVYVKDDNCNYKSLMIVPVI